jgi:ubiquinone/menaquinone biosynthesis C-methylase UbiE
MVVLEEIEQVRAAFLKYTRAAFLRLPRLEKPRILDIGCGSGVPTLELAKLSDGEVTGIDIDQSCIDEFNRKIKEENLASRVKAINLSLSEMKFPDETFDAVWSEGVIGTIEFERSLKEWRRLLKHNGYLVIHYQVSRAADTLSRMPQHGYRLVDTVSLPEDAWWTEFYKPIEEKIGALLHKYRNNPDALKLLKQYKSEMDMVKKNPLNFRSAFYIMKKIQ